MIITLSNEPPDSPIALQLGDEVQLDENGYVCRVWRDDVRIWPEQAAKPKLPARQEYVGGIEGSGALWHYQTAEIWPDPTEAIEAVDFCLKNLHNFFIESVAQLKSICEQLRPIVEAAVQALQDLAQFLVDSFIDFRELGVQITQSIAEAFVSSLPPAVTAVFIVWFFELRNVEAVCLWLMPHELARPPPVFM